MDFVYKDPEDSRDLLFTASATVTPPRTDLRSRLIDIEDQVSTNSCTAHAGTSALEVVAGDKVERSRLFLYYNVRLLSNLQNTDTGAYTRDICKALAKWGCPPESIYPFNPMLVNVPPPATAYREGEKFRIEKYERCADIRAAVAEGFPVIIGARVRQKLNALSGPMNTHLAYLKDYPSTPVMGGHAMVVVGYDDKDASYIIANSWGTKWGDNGCFKIDRGMIHADMLDAWAIRGVKASTMDDTTAQVYRLYTAALGRKPDQAGLDYWCSVRFAGTSLKDIARSFTESEEFVRKYGATTDEQFIALLYQNVLHREPDAAGYEYWLASKLDRIDILLEFSESAENKANNA